MSEEKPIPEFVSILIPLIRKAFPQQLAEQIANTPDTGSKLLTETLQLLASNGVKLPDELAAIKPDTTSDEAVAALFSSAKKADELTLEGYEPVSGLGLMWVKRD